MDFYPELSLPQRTVPVISLVATNKLVGVAQFAALNEHSRVIDFGCGYGEALLAWADHFGVSGVGIDIGDNQIDYARRMCAASPHADRIAFVKGDGATYAFEPGSFDMAACICAADIFAEPSTAFRAAIRHLADTIKPNGYLLMAQPFYNSPDPPAELVEYEGALSTEDALVAAIHDEGFEIAYMIHADRADWDRYISSNLHFSVKWLKSHRDHADFDDALERHRYFLRMYIEHRQRYQECGVYLLTRL